MSTASFRERFKDRTDTVARDGANSFSYQQQQPPPGGRASNASVNRSRYSLLQQQQQQQQQHGAYDPPAASQRQSPPPQQQPSHASAVSGYTPQVAGAQPSFFMTGGGFAASPSPQHHNAAGSVSMYASPYAPPNAQQQQHQQPQQLATSYDYDLDDPQQQQLNTPHHQRQQRQAGGGFTKELVTAANNATMSPGSPLSAGRRTRRKEALPDFRELEVIQHGRRAGRAVERMPVLVDHPNTGEYHQHTLSEYRAMVKEYQNNRFGGLGPEDNEEKQAAREKNKKMLEYGRQVNAVNFAVLDQLMGDSWHNRPIEKKLDPETQLGLIKRQRAMQYAEAVQPPSTKKASNSARSSPVKHPPPKSKTPQPGGGGGGSSSMNANGSHLGSGDDLMSLEEKHRRDQEAIRRIKAQLNMI